MHVTASAISVYVVASCSVAFSDNPVRDDRLICCRVVMLSCCHVVMSTLSNWVDQSIV